MLKIGFCGVGNMAGAILKSALSNGVFNPEQVIAFNPTKSKLDDFCGITVAQSNREVCENSDIVFLGFKPQKLSDIAPDLRGVLNSKTVVSMLAGISTDKLHDALGCSSVIRVMPNTPIVVGSGCTAVAKGDADDDVYDFVCSIFEASGQVVHVKEDEINRTIPLSGSSPAFYFRFIRAMCDAGVKSGLDYEVSKKLALSTMHGVCHLMEHSDKTPDELIAQVTSPGGTTLAGLTAFDDFEFEKMIESVFERTVNRAEELGK